MIEKKDIEKLAALSRIKLGEEEKERFTKEIDSILEYVKQIQEITASADLSEKLPLQYPHRNILREDVEDRNLLESAEVLVAGTPGSKDGYIKVKKILG